jgi:hypothetical protein
MRNELASSASSSLSVVSGKTDAISLVIWYVVSFRRFDTDRPLIWFASSLGSMVIRSRLAGFRLLKGSTTHREEFASSVESRGRLSVKCVCELTEKRMLC